MGPDSCAAVELKVVEGGAVVTLTLTASMTYYGDEGEDEMPDVPPDPELLAYRADLISDTRAVMKALKTD